MIRTITMGHPAKHPALLLPVSVDGAPTSEAVTQVRVGDSVVWAVLPGQTVTVKFAHGPTPLASGERTVQAGAAGGITEVGLFPYDVIIGNQTFFNGGALDVGPRE